MNKLLMRVSMKHGVDRPLVIILDSVDQLIGADNAHSMLWLPKIFPANVHCVVSFIPTLFNCLENAMVIIL